METGLSKMKRHLANGDYEEALKLAARWGDLGAHKEAITRGYEALMRPAFYEQLGKDPDFLFREGVRALFERYHIPHTEEPGFDEWQRFHQYLIEQVNDGTEEGIYKATGFVHNVKTYPVAIYSYGKTKALAIRELEFSMERYVNEHTKKL